MPKKVKIFVSHGGTELRYLHTDGLDMDRFGPKQINRVTDIEPDNPSDSREWVATLRDGTEIARGKSREELIQKEREVIEQMLSEGHEIPTGE